MNVAVRPQQRHQRFENAILLRTVLLFVGVCLLLLTSCASPRRPISVERMPSPSGMPGIFEPIAEVWPGAPVKFDLLTYDNQQFVAFYDQDRFLTVGARLLGSSTWTFKRLNDQFGGWDAHNYLTMAVDDDGNLHLAGDMHARPLKYWRTTRPLDIHTLVRQPCMVCADSANESDVTYPRFFRGPANEFLFMYRQGYSGKGKNYVNVYHSQAHTWRRFLPQPLFAYPGEARSMNAYPLEFLRDARGIYHAVWTWRDPGGAERTHDLSYARSRDLRTWERSDGAPLSLPLTIDNTQIIDPAPVRGGLMNLAVVAGFDTRNRLIISYHKYDAHGRSQIYNARLEGAAWRIYQTSQWTCRWNFGGRGSFPPSRDQVRVGKVRIEADRGLSQAYHSCDGESGRWRLDEVTLQPIGREHARRGGMLTESTAIEPQVTQICGYTDIQQRRVIGRGNTAQAKQYRLYWTALGPHWDRPRKNCTDPAPSILWLYKAS